MKPMSTRGLLKFARLGINYGMRIENLSLRLSFLAYPHRVTQTNARRLQEEILAQGTFGKYYSKLADGGKVYRIRPTRKIT